MSVGSQYDISGLTVGVTTNMTREGVVCVINLVW